MLQDRSFLRRAGPRELLEQPLDAYAPLLRDGEHLADADLQILDYVVRNQVARLLDQRADADALSELSDSIEALVPVHREEELASWLARWRGMAAVLEARAASLDAQDPTDALGMAHAEEIMELVTAEPGIAQKSLREALGLKPANLSRILSLLEANELIERRKVGRQNQVFPGRKPPESPIGGRPPGTMKSPRLFLLPGPRLPKAG